MTISCHDFQQGLAGFGRFYEQPCISKIILMIKSTATVDCHMWWTLQNTKRPHSLPMSEGYDVLFCYCYVLWNTLSYQTMLKQDPIVASHFKTTHGLCAYIGACNAYILGSSRSIWYQFYEPVKLTTFNAPRQYMAITMAPSPSQNNSRTTGNSDNFI